VPFQYRLVDDEWNTVGDFIADGSVWGVGDEFEDAHGRRFAITGIVPNPDESVGFAATWTVESA
jgi:hypothetical protein